MTSTRTRLLIIAALTAIAIAMAAGTGAAAANAASFTISGRVTDTAGKPIQNATVTLYRDTPPDNPWFNAEDVTTDANGEYTINYSGYWTSGDGNDAAVNHPTSRHSSGWGSSFPPTARQ